MYAVIGKVRLKRREQEALALVGERGAAMLRGMAGSAGGYWARALTAGEMIQHSFWLFDTEPNARSAEATFNTLRDLPDAPAVFASVGTPNRSARDRSAARFGAARRLLAANASALHLATNAHRVLAAFVLAP